MKKTTFTLLIFLMTISAYCQTKENKFNFDFEQIENGIPIGWAPSYNQNYTVSLDSINVKKGKYSILIEFNDGIVDYRSIDFNIPDSYDGKKITLSGYIKTENVTEGFAGLFMKIEPDIAFNNMEDIGVKGSVDWNKYEIVLEMDPLKTEKIIFGGFLAGKGKMWLDDLTITIDGNKLEDLNPIIIPAKTDKEFDNGSLISDFNFDKTKIENLKTLGLVWGFLKYYHPNIAKGEFNWDYELFRVLPKVLNVKNNKERDVVLVAWITQLGQFEQATEIKSDTMEIKMKPDLDWISNSKFSNELTTLLLSIQNAERSDNNYYVSILFDGTGPPSFLSENPYPAMKFPDVGFRILAVYRYWNIIQYYFPYRYLIGEDWKNVLQEFIPKIINATNETEYTLAILELIGRINDTHANIWGGNQVLNNYKGLNYTPINLSFVENKAVVTYFNDDTLGKETGLQIGDVISKINNKSVESIVKENLKYTPASNYPTKLRDIARKTLLVTNDTIINIEYIRDHKIENKFIKANSSNKAKIWKKEYDNLADTCFKLISPKIAYISNSTLKDSHLPKIWENIKNTDGLIIDCRFSPRYAPLDSLSGFLYPKRTSYAKFTQGNIKTPGLFSSGIIEYSGKDNSNFYKGKVIILVNEDTQSASEFHVKAYQKAPNSIVIGSTTAAADGNISPVFYLPGEIMTMISGIGVYYPNGGETQRIGIVPDIEVKPTIEGIKNGRDELIEKAIEVINKQ